MLSEFSVPLPPIIRERENSRAAIGSIRSPSSRSQHTADRPEVPPNQPARRQVDYQFPAARTDSGKVAYQRLTQRPPPPPRRLIQPPPPPPPLIQPPPRTAPLRFTHAPALASGEEEIQTPPPTAATTAAPDHFPMLRRNKRRSSNSLSAVAVFSMEDSLLIGGKSLGDHLVSLAYAPAPPVSVEKCIAAIRQSPAFFATVSEMFMGKATSFPSFFPVILPDAISQPMSVLTPPILN